MYWKEIQKLVYASVVDYTESMRERGMKKGHSGFSTGSGTQIERLKTLQRMRKCKGDGNDHFDLEYVKLMFLWKLLAL